MIERAGSIDGCHIPPALKHTEYYNRNGWYSVVLQAVVDHKSIQRYICWMAWKCP